MMKTNSFFTVIVSVCLMFGLNLGVVADQTQGAVVGVLSQQIIDALPAPTKIRKELYQRLFEQPLKTTYELIPSSEGLGFSLAVSDIIESAPHYHADLSETYTVIYGALEIFINDKSYVLYPNDVIVVPRKAVHWARSVTGEPARVLVSCVPGWTPEDNHVVEVSKDGLPSPTLLIPNGADTAIYSTLDAAEKLKGLPLKEIRPELYQMSIEFIAKMVYELIPANEGLGFSLALIDLTESDASYHLERSEIYTVISGSVEVVIDGKSYKLQRGDVVAIPVGAVHQVKSTTSEPARVLVSCIPGWIPQDHFNVYGINE